MRRVEPAFPDLFPIGHRLGSLGPAEESPVLDPVEMRLVWGGVSRPHGGDRTLPRRPVRFFAHAETARREAARLASLLETGSGALVVLDDELAPDELPQPPLAGQLVVLAPWRAALWGGGALPDLHAFAARGLPSGVLLALGPAPRCLELVTEAVEGARRAGAEFVLAMPMFVPPEDRHRVYDFQAGEGGDGALEDLLFHTDLGQVTLELEREVTRACLRVSLREGLPGPVAGRGAPTTFGAAASLLLWARRLDLLDGVGSTGWQLRRAARALLASGRDAAVLVAEDNLRIVPGFSPWVEAFARALWGGGGEPFEELLARWVAH